MYYIRFVACLVLVFVSHVGLAEEDCSYSNRKAVMRADAIAAVVIEVKGGRNCLMQQYSIKLHYQSSPRKVVYYQESYPKDIFGFSILRVTPKQLSGMMDKMIDEFLRPVTIAALSKVERCQYHVPTAYIEKLEAQGVKLHAVYSSDSSKKYLAYIEEIDKYVEVVSCSRVRTKQADLAGVPDDPAGAQVFSPDYKYKLLPHLDHPLIRKSLSKHESWTDAGKYKNKLCEPYTSEPHQLELDREDMCMLLPQHCHQNKEIKKVRLFCRSSKRAECFVKNLWRGGNPLFDFAKGIEYSVSRTQTLRVQGQEKKEVCVYWD